MMYRSWVQWLLGLLVLTYISAADAGSSQRTYREKKIEVRKLDRQRWKKAEDGLDYADHRPKPKELKKNAAPTEYKLSGIQQLIIIIIFTLVFAVLIVFLLKELGVNIFQWKKADKEKLFSEEDFTDAIPESELDRMMKEALGRNDFRAAVRIYYLMVIKEFSQRNWIIWKKEKTNSDYLREMKVEEYRPAFRRATTIYETVWYGERSIDAAGFQNINPHFSNLITRIKSSR
ncbi:MAG TPA: DUF4129 domain-containing protein [Chitinophagales bacterium]|nr:DUF4129 domain-containing protein [Chitinophagales bacterium]